jgi:hypothetical protein
VQWTYVRKTILVLLSGLGWWHKMQSSEKWQNLVLYSGPLKVLKPTGMLVDCRAARWPSSFGGLLRHSREARKPMTQKATPAGLWQQILQEQGVPWGGGQQPPPSSQSYAWC